MLYILLLLTAFTHSFGQEEWSYCYPNGPYQWPFLFPRDCSLSNQSPININYLSAEFDSKLDFIVFKGYDQTLSDSTLVNTAHTVEILLNSDEDNRPAISGGYLSNMFILENIHFHWGCTDFRGSEHALDGRIYAMEGHFVHRNEKYATVEEALKHPDGIAVLAVFFEPSRDNCANSSMTTIAEALKDILYPKTEVDFDLRSPVESLLPVERHNFFYYNGSLTTPNCTEAVTWIVFPTLKKIRNSELDEFRKVQAKKTGDDKCVYLCDNFRPLQQRNGRKILRNFTRRYWWQL